MVFQVRADPKSCNRMAAKGIQFLWRWNSGIFSTNLDVIWGMSVDSIWLDERLMSILRSRLGLLLVTGIIGISSPAYAVCQHWKIQGAQIFAWAAQEGKAAGDA